MALSKLNSDVLFLICFELSADDLVALRQVCRPLCNATHQKIIWTTLLNRLLEGAVLPPYLIDCPQLDRATLEALVRRMARVTQKWNSGDLSPANVCYFSVAQSITWMRLVAGNWLFVASADDSVCKIVCWNVSSLFAGVFEPVAEAYLPSPVKTGELDTQDSRIVLALGLSSKTLSVHVITLLKNAKGFSFCELACIKNSSHVLMLSGDYIGCAVRGAHNDPHVINWKERTVYDIPPPTGGADVPGRRSVPHLMTIWGRRLLVIRSAGLEFYTCPSNADEQITFLKIIETPTIWEVSVCPSTPITNHPPPLRLIAISSRGIEMIVIEEQVLAESQDTVECVCLSRYPPGRLPEYAEPWYRLCVGETGQRVLWISAAAEPPNVSYSSPFFVSAPIPAAKFQPIGEVQQIAWRSGETDGPALWANPMVAFDETLGITIFGNCFGELALYDHVGCPRLIRSGLDAHFYEFQSLPGLLPTVPTVLEQPPLKGPKIGMPNEEVEGAVSEWSRDNLELGSFWDTFWPAYSQNHMWQGVPCDLAWYLEHAYGFPGQVIPQAYGMTDYDDYTSILFRIGDRYLVQNHNNDVQTWPLDWVDDSDGTNNIYYRKPQTEACTRRTALTEGTVYAKFLVSELCPREDADHRSPYQHGRNRWREQWLRGGHIDWENLSQSYVCDVDWP